MRLLGRVCDVCSSVANLVILAADESLVQAIYALAQEKAQVAANVCDEAVIVVDHILQRNKVYERVTWQEGR